MTGEKRGERRKLGDFPDSSEPDHVRSQYRSQNNLAVRIRTHELYSETDVDFASWILDALSWHGDERVLDVGCGAGFYIDAVKQRATRYIAGDLSLGMLRELKDHSVPRINLDAQRLPFRRQAADVILANHMLYHVPDIDRALVEFRRVLGARGRLVAATNSARNMAELAALQREVMVQLGAPSAQRFRTNLTFTLENGAQFLSKHFAHVERRDLHDALVFPEAQPVIDYLASSFERYVDYLPDHLSWQDVARTLRTILEPRIKQHSEFRVNKLSGVFICWNN